MGLVFSLFSISNSGKELLRCKIWETVSYVFWFEFFITMLFHEFFCFPNLDNDNEDDDEEEDDTGNWKRQKKTEYPVAYDF